MTDVCTGYQLLFGFGLGGALQNSVIAIQVEYAIDEKLMPQATGIVQFIQFFGGIIGIA